MRGFVLSTLSLCALSTGCAVHGVHVAGLDVPTPAPIVERVDAPLYVVLDGVPATPVAGDRGPALHQLRHFARRPLKQTLETYFETVIVVDSSEHVPDSVPHLELHVTIDELGARPLELAPWDKLTARSVPTLTWGVELQGVEVEAPDFVYTGAVEGEIPMGFLTRADPAIEGLLGAALEDLTTELVVTGTLAELRSPAVEPAPVVVPAPSCDESEDAVSDTL